MKAVHNLLFILLFTPISIFASPTNPSDLVLIPNETSVSLSWKDSSDDESGFKIFRNGKLIHITNRNTVSYIDSGLKPNTTYTYTIKSTDSSITTLETEVLKKYNKVILEKDDFGRAKNIDELRDIWGEPECKNDKRILYKKEGNNRFYRLLMSDDERFDGYINSNGNSVEGYDSSDVERCELGVNEWRKKGSIDGDWPHHNSYVLYQEGEHKITIFSIRLNANFPINANNKNDNNWQSVMQMKQTKPSNHDGVPIISLHVQDAQWQLYAPVTKDSLEEAILIWSTPNNSVKTNRWVNFAFDVVYSQNPQKGSIKVYVDLNNDGDFLDAGEQSPLIKRSTLISETEQYRDYIKKGESIPSHLRIGVYHNSNINCGVDDCSMDLDNVEIFKLNPLNN